MRTWLLPAALWLLLVCGSEPAQAQDPSELPLQVPPVRYLNDVSFRGVGSDGRIPSFDISGHANVLPGVTDFVRLGTPIPLAYGGVFSTQPLTSAEWIVEMAFRVHGPAKTGIADGDERLNKGGRGLAFWLTKSSNPSPVTIGSDSRQRTSPPPPTFPGGNGDAADDMVSFFGNRAAKLDGLGVLFDSAPKSPVYPRSDQRNWDHSQDSGADHLGVISGVLDDGSGSWFEPEGRARSDDSEADYLDRAIGECEAAFRNAQGLLWARVSYINNTIRVDLDLAPHTTLAKAGRDYAHNCFALSGINLDTNYHVGITALSGGNTEPDTVDVYALDAFEVVKDGEVAGDNMPADRRNARPLEGTLDDADVSFAHELFLSQAKMMQAIDDLSERIDVLTSYSRDIVASRLTSIERQVAELPADGSVSNSGSTGASSHAVNELIQLQERVMAEVKALGRKLDTSSGQSSASLSGLTARSNEIVSSLRQYASTVEDKVVAGAASGAKYSWFLFGAAAGTLGAVAVRRQIDRNRSKKLI